MTQHLVPPRIPATASDTLSDAKAIPKPQPLRTPDLPSDIALRIGGYSARITADLHPNALALRSRVFRRATALAHGEASSDRDAYDPLSLHGTVTRDGLSVPLIAFRLRVLRSPGALQACYTGQSYDLSRLGADPGPWVELGRFCQDPASRDVHAIRLAWAAIGALVDQARAAMLFGCSSFAGTDITRHSAALSYLREYHLGPQARRPRARSFQAAPLPAARDAVMPPRDLPPLLRSYLGLGGWVSDHCVRDPELDTCHVFTGLDIAAIPAPRLARLRALAQAAAWPSATPLDATAPDQ